MGYVKNTSAMLQLLVLLMEKTN